MRRLVLALLACMFAIPSQSWAQTVSGSGISGTIPVWTGSPNPVSTIGKLGGPTPWIDFVAAGGVGDAQTNTSASMSVSTTNLTTTSGPAFASGDVGKVVGVLGAGLAAATVTGSTTFGSTGTLVCGATYHYKITYVAEDSSSHAFLSESPPTASTAVTVTGCTGNVGSITFSGFSTTNGTGYRVYFASTSGRETLQPVSTAACTLTAGGNACAKTSSYTLNSDVLDGPLPPTVSVLVTSIKTYTSGTAVVTNNPAIQGVSSTTIMWGTNNDGAWSTVLGTCAGTGGGGTNPGRGCLVFFPGSSGGATGSNSPTGDYLTLAGFTNQTSGGVNVPGIVLVGGGTGLAGTFSSFLPSAEVVGVSRIALVSIGKTAATTSAFAVENLGFRDPFGGPSVNAVGQYIARGELYGGLSLLNADHFYLNRTSFVNFGAGYGIQLDTELNTNRQTQIGSINDAYCVSCLVGISAPYDASDVDINGGRFEGTSPLVASNTTNVAASIGLDLEWNEAPTHTQLGNIRVRGGAIVNFNTGVSTFDCESCTIIQEKFERIGNMADSSSTAISIDGTGTSTCYDNQAVSDVIAGFPTGIAVTANCTRSAILLPSIVNVTTPISDAGANSLELNNVTNGTSPNPGLELSSTAHVTSSAANSSVAGTCTISSGGACSPQPSFSRRYSNAPVCTAANQTGARTFSVSPSASGLTINGTSGDTVAWICVGNPN